MFLKYCDGASYSGANDTVTVVNGKPLHFRGKYIENAFIDDLLTNRGVPLASCCAMPACSVDYVF